MINVEKLMAAGSRLQDHGPEGILSLTPMDIKNIGDLLLMSAKEIADGRKLAAAAKAMRANVTEPERATCSCGSITSVCNWYTVATCEYGERVDDALKPFEEQ